MLRDVVDEVGADIARFVMLMRKNDAPLDFDFDKALEESKDNPVFMSSTHMHALPQFYQERSRMAWRRLSKHKSQTI